MASTLTCGVCSEDYTDPVLLSCLHTFCKKCIIKDEQAMSVVSCPVCNESVSSWTNLNIFKCPALIENRVKVHVDLAIIQSKMRGLDKVSCDDCDDNAVVFCCNCNSLLCEFCKTHHQRVKKTASHVLVEVDHSFKRSPDVADHSVPLHCDIELVRGLEESLIVYDQIVDSLDGALAIGREKLENINKREEEVKKELIETFSSLQSALEMRCQALLKRTGEIANKKRSLFNDQILHGSLCKTSRLIFVILAGL
jgi:hypothetical protein